MPIERPKIKRGDVYVCDPGPVVGHGQGEWRPFLVVSIEQMNLSPASMAIAVPLTTTDRQNKLHVRVEPPEGGLERVSFAMPEMVRSVSSLRLRQRLGRTSMDAVESVTNRIGLLVGLGRAR
jgi:mRNA interferase MazF